MIKKFLSDSVYSLAGRIVFAASILIFQMLVSKSLTANEYGIFGKWFVALEYFVALLSLGLNVSLIYYSKHKLLSACDSQNLNTYVYILLALVLFPISALQVMAGFDAELLLMAVLSTSIWHSLIAYYQSNGRFPMTLMLLMAQGIAVLGIGVYVYYQAGVAVYVSKDIEIMYVWLQYALLLVILPYHKLMDCIGFKFGGLGVSGIFGYVSYGLKGVVMNTLGKTLLLIDIAIAGYYLPNEQIALYVAASTIVKIIWLLIDAVGQALFPILVEKKDDADILIYYVSQLSFVLSIVSVVVFYYYGEELLALMFTAEYKAAFLSTIILLASAQGMVLYKLINRKLASNNRWREVYIVLLIAIGCNVVLNFILVPKYGINGAAFASFVCYWLCGLWLVRFTNLSVVRLLLPIK